MCSVLILFLFKLIYFISHYKTKVAIGDQYGSIKIYNENNSLICHINAHSDAIERVRFYPERNVLVSCSRDTTVKIWNMNDLSAPIQIFKHENESYAFEFLNANTMATGSWDNTVKIWNITNGILIRTIHIESHVNCIKKVSDRQIAVASNLNDIKLYSYSDGKKGRTLKGHTSVVNDLELLGDDKLASASDDSTILIWRVKDGTILFHLKGHLGFVSTLKFIESLHLLVSSAEDKLVKIWNIQTGKLKKTLKGHEDQAHWSIDFIPKYNDDKEAVILFIGELTGKISFWELYSNRSTKLNTMTINEGVWALTVLRTKSKKDLTLFFYRFCIQKENFRLEYI